ncbi:MAG: hypothetical protein JNK12_07775 [Acidimicrobiales bacterium]|nr:hypothetical protein [Acidimicrobiales bacterium]
MPTPEVTVGVDIGTTSVKAVAADGEGNVVARARVRHPIGIPAPGRFEHDIDRAWRRNVRRAFREVSRDLDVRGVNVAAMVPSLGAVDAKGRALTPGLLYGDERGRTDGGADPASSGELVEFLRWLAAEAPAAAGFWPAQGVANHALSGEGAIDTVTAMTALPLFTGVQWDADVAGAAGVRLDQLPRVVPGSQPVGTVTGTDVLVGGGTIDAFGEQLVAGADDAGDVLVILGTTLITWAVIDEWREVPGLWTIPHTAPGKVLLGGPSNAGGLFLNWATGLLGRATDTVDPHHVPVWLPYVRGERTPLHDPDRRAVLHDLDLTHGAAAARRAAYEAAGFVVRHHLDLGEVDARRIVATGGGTHSIEWVQCLADATGLPVDVVAVPEGGALGAAYLARVTAGLERSAADAGRWARTGRRVEPDPTWAGPMERRYQRFRELTAAAGA